MARALFSNFRRMLAIAIIASVAGAGLVVFAKPQTAAAVGDTTLTVRITEGDGSAAAGLTLWLDRKDGSFTRLFATEKADRPGSYDFSGVVSATDYILSYYKQNFPLTYFGSTNADAASATHLRFSPGHQVLEITKIATDWKAGMPTGTIKGKVTREKYGTFAATVTLFRLDGDNWVRFDQKKASRTGSYSFSKVPGGQSYKVYVSDSSAANSLARYIGGADDLEKAPSYYLPNKGTLTLNTTMLLGGSISGYLGNTSLEAATSMNAVALKLTGEAPNYTGYERTPGFDDVSYVGSFTINRLSPGDYVVYFRSFNVSNTSEGFAGGGVRWDSPETTVIRVGKGKVGDAGTTLLPYPGTALGNTRSTLSVNILDENGASYATGVATLDGVGDIPYTSAAKTPVKSGNTTVFKSLAYGEYRVHARDSGNVTPYKLPAGTTLTVNTPSVSVNLQLGIPTSFEFTSTSLTNSDTALVGTTYEAEGIPSIPVPVSYSWWRDGQPIAGASSASYTAASGDLGHSIAVRMTATAEMYFPIVAYQEVDGVVEIGAAPENASVPVVSASSDPVQPGTRLTTDGGLWDIAGVHRDFVWTRDGSAIAGATGSSYLVTTEDATHDIAVGVVAKKYGREDSLPIYSAAVSATVAGTILNKKMPTVSSSTRGLSGSKRAYTVSNGSWSVASPSYHYTWFADLTPLSETSHKFIYDPSDTDVSGKVISVEVTAARTGYVDGSATAVARAGELTPSVAVEAKVHNLTTDDEIDSDSTTVTVGDTLMATSGDLDFGLMTPDDVKTTFVWQRSRDGIKYSAISKATKPTYVVASSDAGMHLRVLATTSTKAFRAVTQTATAGTGQLPQTLIDAAPELKLVGSGAFGTVHRAVLDSAWPVSSVTNSYAWFSCDPASMDCELTSNFRPISKATKSTYTPSAALDGQVLVVRVTATKKGYAPSVLRATVGPLHAPLVLSAVAPPRLSAGSSAETPLGTTRTLVPAEWDVPGVTRSFQWQYCVGELDGECAGDGTGWGDLVGATSLSVTILAPELTVGTRLRVVESASKAGYPSVDVASSPTTLVDGAFALVTAPKITQSSDLLLVASGGFTPSVESTTFQWHADALELSTSNELDLSTVDAAAAIWVDVTAHRAGFADRTERVLWRKGAAPEATPTAIVGVSYGSPLVAPDPSLFIYPADPGAVTTRYQWYVAGKPVSGAKSSSYSPSSSSVGKAISVVISQSSNLYETAVYPTSAVTLTSGTIDGTVELSAPNDLFIPGAKVSTTTSFNASSSLSYEWQRSLDSGDTWATISGQKKSTYSLTPSDVERQVRVVVTAKKTGFSTTSVTSDGHDVAYLPPLVNLGAPQLTGSAKVGTLLTVSAGTWSVSGLSYSYEWYRNGHRVADFSAGAMSLQADSYGDDLQVKVTASRAGYVPIIEWTPAVTVLEGAAPTNSSKPKVTGTLVVGSTIRATPGSWNRSGLQFNYQWYSDGVLIGGVTTSELTLAPEVEGTSITVEATASLAGFEAGSAKSSPSKHVTG
jgi:hypothetical protein